MFGVDYLTHPGRTLPDGHRAERFEVVLLLINHERRGPACECGCRCRSADPTLPSLFGLWPGTEAVERETFDMFGITFTGHPDLTRILMPEDWVGPSAPQGLRRRRDPGAVLRGPHRAAAGRRGPGMTWPTSDPSGTSSSEPPFLTGEGSQEMRPRSELGPDELLREVGSVLRMSEAEAAALAEQVVDPSEDQTMIINMGPQHPSTHGVLRLMLELQGETVLRCKPIVGYLHTGMEKTGEELTYLQGGTNVTRMDYASPLTNELVFSLATEKLLGIDGDIPERAMWIRMLLVELNRMSSHLLFLATNGMDIGAVSMMIYGWREREIVLRFLQKVTGLRMNHNFIRPGRCGRRSARRLAGRRARADRHHHAPAGGVRHADDRAADLARAAAGRRRAHRAGGAGPRRHRAHPALDRAWPGTSGGTCPTCTTTRSSST